MDPISRRHVWDVIEQAKQDRAIILTTHSMEEGACQIPTAQYDDHRISFENISALSQHTRRRCSTTALFVMRI
jgi:ABC-type phosphate transport system ATPase subunit